MRDLYDLAARATADPTGAVVAELNNHVIEEFRANSGKVAGPFASQDLLLLHHRGAKTGGERVNPLGYLRHQDTLFIVASSGAAATNPSWYHNIKAHPEITIEVGAETMAVVAYELSDDERSSVWPVFTARYPALTQYEKSTSRRMPVFRLALADNA